MDRSQSLSQPPSRQMEQSSPRSRWLAFAMALIFSGLGLHRFYVGKFWSAVLFILTGGGLGLWWIYDLVMLATGQFTDNEGRVLGPPRNRHQHRLQGRQGHDDFNADAELDGLKKKQAAQKAPAGADGSLAGADGNTGDSRDNSFVVETDDGEEFTIDESEVMGDSLEKEFQKLEKEHENA